MNTVAQYMSLPERTAHDIRTAIEASTYANGRLPAEPVLALQLGVSKATLRAAVSILEQEGLLSRRHGSGTFVVERAVGMNNNLTINFGVTELIESSGFAAGTTSAAVVVEDADAATQAALGIEAGDRVVVLRRIRTADGRVVASTTDSVALKLFVERELSDSDAVELFLRSESLYDVMASIGLGIRDGVAEISPAVADDKLAELLHAKPGALMLRLEQTDYDVSGAAIVHSIEFFVADVFKFQVFRKGRVTARRAAGSL